MGVIYNKSRIEDVAKLVDSVSGTVEGIGTSVTGLTNTVNGFYTDDGKAIVLNSSTAESTKKFKITVADNGTISATEIVAE